MSAREQATCPKRNFLGHGVRCLRRPGHDGNCEFPAGLGVVPPESASTRASALAANSSLLAELEELRAAQEAALRVTVRALKIRPVPPYPDTSYLVLCANPERKSGRVTVGESRLPVGMVLAVLRLHGLEEARVQWPQLSGDELAVLEQLAADLAVEEADDDE